MISQLLYSKNLITDAEAETAVNNLTDNEEIKTYNKRNAIGHFLISIKEKLSYADLLLAKQHISIATFTREARTALQFLEMPAPLRLTFEEYEQLKKEATKQYFKENNKKLSLFEIALLEIKSIYDFSIAKGEELIEAYKDHPLTEEEQAFYGDTTETENIDYVAKTEETKALLKQGKYKEAVLCYLSDKHTIKEKKTYDKGDIAYDLYEYWNESDKSPKTFKKIIKDYTEILELALYTVSEKYFKGKYDKTRLEETQETYYTLQELYEKHRYNLLPEIIKSPVLLTEYRVEETAEDTARMYTEAFMKTIDSGLFKQLFERYEETLIAIENMNILLDLALEETGVTEIEQLKYNTEERRKDLQSLYLELCRVAFSPAYTENSKANSIKTAVENVCNINIRIKNTPIENINKARELLRSSKKFKEYQADLFKLIAGVYSE
jgi:hypothetical protein